MRLSLKPIIKVLTGRGSGETGGRLSTHSARDSKSGKVEVGGIAEAEEKFGAGAAYSVSIDAETGADSFASTSVILGETATGKAALSMLRKLRRTEPVHASGAQYQQVNAAAVAGGTGTLRVTASGQSEAAAGQAD
jgi:hypothetical protein